jgi:hypothetical protein
MGLEPGLVVGVLLSADAPSDGLAGDLAGQGHPCVPPTCSARGVVVPSSIIAEPVTRTLDMES